MLKKLMFKTFFILENKKLKIKGRIWLETSNGAEIGAGKIELLEKIAELGSLRQAALEMKMSYRQAWGYINQLNKITENKVVILKRGGKSGGKAEITDFGNYIISSYKKMLTNFEKFMIENSNSINEKKRLD